MDHSNGCFPWVIYVVKTVHDEFEKNKCHVWCSIVKEPAEKIEVRGVYKSNISELGEAFYVSLTKKLQTEYEGIAFDVEISDVNDTVYVSWHKIV